MEHLYRIIRYEWGRMIELMKRTNLHVKIELELKEDDQPEKIAAEICRQLLKLYGVRSAEVSSLVAQD